MTFPGDTVNYTLAEALVRQDYPAAGTWNFTAFPPLNHIKPELQPAADRKRKMHVPDKPIDPAELVTTIAALAKRFVTRALDGESEL